MGLADRKEREKDEMRRKILDAAKILFLDQGYEKTSIRNIADAIEYSPGTMYHYFKDKNDLFYELHREAINSFIKIFGNVINIEDPFEQLLAMGVEYLKFSFENPELYDLMFIMSAPIETLDCREDVWKEGHTTLDMLKVMVERCQKEGYFQNQNIEDLSVTIWALVHGLASIHLRKRSFMFPEEERVAKLERALLVFNIMLKNL